MRKEKLPEPFLILEFEGQEVRRFDLDRQRTAIGRSREAEIQIAMRGVSRFHAEVLRDDSGACLLKDLGSANGTFVNGQRIEGPRELVAGDVINFLDYALRFGRETVGDQQDRTITDATDIGKKTFSPEETVPTEEAPVPHAAQQDPTSPSDLRFRIEVRDDALGNSTHAIERPVTIVGGDATSHLRISGKRVERLHSLLVLVDEKLLFVRLSPLHIARVNGTARMVTFVEPGDQIAIAESTLVVERAT